MPLRALLTAAAVLAGVAPDTPAQEVTGEVWPEIDAYVRLSLGARLFFQAQPVMTADDRSLSERQLGGHLEAGFMPMARKHLQSSYDADRLRYLRARVGFRRVSSYGTDGTMQREHRLVADFTPRAFLPFNVLLAQRNQLDARWIEGDYSWRFRPRVWLERETRIGAVTTVPYWSVEFFYDARFDAWSRTLYQTGIVIPVTPRIAPEIYYARQIDRQPALKTVNALGTMATLYF
jgi:hypothetical protein